MTYEISQNALDSIRTRISQLKDQSKNGYKITKRLIEENCKKQINPKIESIGDKPSMKQVLIKDKLDNYMAEFLSKNSTFDVKKIKNELFSTNTKFDVFLSHAHKDLKEVRAFKLYLKDKYNPLNVMEKTLNNYKHVNMILNTSLTEMIRKTKHFIFIESENSTTMSYDTNSTLSPWVFLEVDYMTALLSDIQSEENVCLLESMTTFNYEIQTNTFKTLTF